MVAFESGLDLLGVAGEVSAGVGGVVEGSVCSGVGGGGAHVENRGDGFASVEAVDGVGRDGWVECRRQGR
jgi:hypothetical protein